MADAPDTAPKTSGPEDEAPVTPRSPGVHPLPSTEPPPHSGGVKSIRQLASALDEPPPPSMTSREREELAKRRVGAMLKGWRLVRLLGVGPICAAYESFRGADDSGEHVVLKLMIGQMGQHERGRAMMLRGAYASNRFTHPRVLPLTSDGTDADGAPFIVRTWVDAEPLEQVVRRSEKGLGEEQVLRIAEQVLDALEIAHSHGIVHGALTPNNILVTPRGSIRICDFSIPPGMGPRTSDEHDLLATRRVGPFSAPERCAEGSGHVPAQASEQTDLYMLAACMYYAVSKEMPRGKAATSVQLATTEATPVRQVCSRVSEAFAAVVDHALALEPEARFESAYAMLGDIRRVMAGRRPKLGDARRPVPSGSVSTFLAASREAPASIRGGMRDFPLSTASPRSTAAAPRNQWKGNVALILAIALLVGIATFVMVREKVEEARAQDLREEQEKLEKARRTLSGADAGTNTGVRTERSGAEERREPAEGGDRR